MIVEKNRPMSRNTKMSAGEIITVCPASFARIEGVYLQRVAIKFGVIT